MFILSGNGFLLLVGIMFSSGRGNDWAGSGEGVVARGNVRINHKRLMFAWACGFFLCFIFGFGVVH
tara:strand:- start:671 stop:868 length:198 start_codon:yes stop_codon:yes gene_type:complete